MVQFAALSRFDVELAGGPRAPGAGPVGIDEVRALQEIDVALLPAEADLVGLHATTARFRALRASDDLRLPPPPSGASGDARHSARLAALISMLEARSSGSDISVRAAIDRMLAVLRDLEACQAEVEQFRVQQSA